MTHREVKPNGASWSERVRQLLSHRNHFRKELLQTWV
jgi:hypothetical protein